LGLVGGLLSPDLVLAPYPLLAVSVCGAPTGFDSGEPRWRRKTDKITIDPIARNSAVRQAAEEGEPVRGATARRREAGELLEPLDSDVCGAPGVSLRRPELRESMG
jgi:hypothetical protein